MSDYIVRATAADSQIRAFAATTRDLVEYARNRTIPVRWQQQLLDVF